MSLLRSVKPMGIYETLYAFQSATGVAMGEAGTHPWSQGYPRTDVLPDGPDFPNRSGRTPEQRMYPKAWGEPELREAVARYYQRTYGAKITSKNVMIFGGGRPGLFALLTFLAPGVEVRIAATEYTPYWDMLQFLGRPYSLVQSDAACRFHVNEKELLKTSGISTGKRIMAIMSNPCNPTGAVIEGARLADLVSRASGSLGLLSDEAYEWFVKDQPVSALQYVTDINSSNVFVVGATTKNFQDPGLRLGWVIGPENDIETLGNFSSFGMGGVSRPSQLEAVALLEPSRVEKARAAVTRFYRDQRDRYGEALVSLGLEVVTGNGGFYHWCKLPDSMSADEFNRNLFRDKAAILPGPLCDMARGGEGYRSPLNNYFRFSFGPLKPESFERNIEMMRRALN